VYDIRPCRNCTVCDVFKELEPPVTVVMVVCVIEAMVTGCVDVVECVNERMMDAADVCRGGSVEGMVENLDLRTRFTGLLVVGLIWTW